MKSHLPAVNLKILTQTPNLTSNFETHKNVGGNFYFVYKYIYTCSIFPQSMKKIEGHFWWPSHPSHPSNPSNPSHQTRATRSLLDVFTGPRREIVGIKRKLNFLLHNFLLQITSWNPILFTLFLKNHVNIVILKSIPQLPNLTSNFEKKARCRMCFWDTLLLAWF